MRNPSGPRYGSFAGVGSSGDFVRGGAAARLRGVGWRVKLAKGGKLSDDDDYDDYDDDDDDDEEDDDYDDYDDDDYDDYDDDDDDDDEEDDEDDDDDDKDELVFTLFLHSAYLL